MTVSSLFKQRLAMLKSKVKDPARSAPPKTPANSSIETETSVNDVTVSPTNGNIMNPSCKHERDETTETEGRSTSWHPRYSQDQGPEITVESDDGCLFRIKRSLLASHRYVELCRP